MRTALLPTRPTSVQKEDPEIKLIKLKYRGARKSSDVGNEMRNVGMHKNVRNCVAVVVVGVAYYARALGSTTLHFVKTIKHTHTHTHITDG